MELYTKSDNKFDIYLDKIKSNLDDIVYVTSYDRHNTSTSSKGNQIK